MARVRNISPRAAKDEDLARLSPWARLAFLLLPTIADCKGRLEDRPQSIKLEILPWDDVDMNSILEELARPRDLSPGPFIRRYEVQGRRYIEILRFGRYQSPHPNERAAYQKAAANGEVIPAPVKGIEEDVASNVSATAQYGPDNVPATSPIPRSVPADDGTGRAGSSDPGSSGSSDPESLARDKLALPTSPRVYWDHAVQNVVIDEDWLREELQEYSAQLKTHLNREDYRHERERLRRELLRDPRLRACIVKQNGKPSTPSKFRALASYTVSRFKAAIDYKADKRSRASPKSTAERRARTDEALREVMREVLEEESIGEEIGSG